MTGLSGKKTRPGHVLWRACAFPDGSMTENARAFDFHRSGFASVKNGSSAGSERRLSPGHLCGHAGREDTMRGEKD